MIVLHAGLALASIVVVLFFFHLMLSLTKHLSHAINRNLTIIEGCLASIAGILLTIGWLLNH